MTLFLSRLSPKLLPSAVSAASAASFLMIFFFPTQRATLYCTLILVGYGPQRQKKKQGLPRVRRMYFPHHGSSALGLTESQGWTCSFTAPEAEGARRRGPPGHCLGCQAVFVDQMSKTVLGRFHLKDLFDIYTPNPKSAK